MGFAKKLKEEKVNNMTRIKKINFLLTEGEIIDYHYNNYKYQRRLIIDRINELEYHNTVGDQSLAAKTIDSMYEKYTK